MKIFVGDSLEKQGVVGVRVWKNAVWRTLQGLGARGPGLKFSCSLYRLASQTSLLLSRLGGFAMKYSAAVRHLKKERDRGKALLLRVRCDSFFATGRLLAFSTEGTFQLRAIPMNFIPIS